MCPAVRPTRSPRLGPRVGAPNARGVHLQLRRGRAGGFKADAGVITDPEILVQALDEEMDTLIRLAAPSDRQVPMPTETEPDTSTHTSTDTATVSAPLATVPEALPGMTWFSAARPSHRPPQRHPVEPYCEPADVGSEMSHARRGWLRPSAGVQRPRSCSQGRAPCGGGSADEPDQRFERAGARRSILGAPARPMVPRSAIHGGEPALSSPCRGMRPPPEPRRSPHCCSPSLRPS